MGDGNNIKFYVDGIHDGPSTPLTVFSNGDAAFPAYIGATRVGNGAFLAGMNGAIDELNIFNRVLTQEEIQGLAAKKSIEEVEFENTVTGKYRYGYQGQFAERDDETGWNHFEAREFDVAIGRWFITDPVGEHWSPYLGMGNSPANTVDPDGRCETCPKDGKVGDLYDPGGGMTYEMTDNGWTGIGGTLPVAEAVTKRDWQSAWFSDVNSSKYNPYIYSPEDINAGLAFEAEVLSMIIPTDAVASLAFKAYKYYKSYKTAKNVAKVAKTSSRILGWGDNAKGHLIKHADVLGYGGHTPQQLQKMLPQLRGAANQLLNNANPALTRVGQWHGHKNAIMYISNGKMLVTEANGTFITVINKTANQWYNAAKQFK